VTFRDLVAQYSTTVGTGDVLLDGVAKTNCRTVAAAYAVDAVASFTMLDTATGDSMVFRGRYKAAPDRLEIVSVRLAIGPNASGPTSPVDWQAGEKLVVHDVAAGDFSTTPTAGAIPVAGSDGKIDQGWTTTDIATGIASSSKAYGVPTHWVPSGVSTLTMVANESVCQVFQCTENVALSEMVLVMSSPSGAGTQIQFAVREVAFSSPDQWTMGAVLADSGLLPADSGLSKVVTGLSVALSRGRFYALQAVSDGTPTLRGWASTPLASMTWGGSTTLVNRTSRFTVGSSYPITSAPALLTPVGLSVATLFCVVGLYWERP
jgi:hypothetical protein